jgi:DNA-binding XRE family transcriptional regulator
MELAGPSIGTAFDACVAAGAATIVVGPYLLWPGNHWERDIPALAAEASTRHRDVAFLVTAPLGPHPLLMTIVDDRIRYCVAHATGEEPECAISGQVSTFTAGTLAELATVLVKARVARGWTQRQLADALGVVEQQVQRYEANGYRSTSLARLCDIADALGVRVEQRDHG